MPGKRVYIEEKVFDKLVALHSEQSKEVALSRAVETYLKARTLVLSELRRYFTRQEIVGMLDAFNGTAVQGLGIPARHLLRDQMEDAEQYEGLAERHGYDPKALADKLEDMSVVQSEFWMEELMRFWVELSGKEGGMDDFLEYFAPSSELPRLETREDWNALLKNSKPITREEFLKRHGKKNDPKDGDGEVS